MDPSGVLDRIGARRGHFRMESGLHAALWFDLAQLFVDPKTLDPIVAELAMKLRPHGVDAVCGPLVGGGLVAQLLARRLDIECYFTERVRTGDDSRLFSARYQLPPGVREQVGGKRMAIVDDVMSAGSSLRATMDDLTAHGAVIVVVGALFVLGSKGAEFFAHHGLAVESAGQSAFDMWPAEACPLCAAGSAVEDVG
jgi:orotate phosphoribosyltransferase